jgi:hypothetical protein
VGFKDNKSYQSLLSGKIRNTAQMDPSEWDLSTVIHILVNLIDQEMFMGDFLVVERNQVNYNMVNKLKQVLRDTKMVRNQVSHSKNVEMREVYAMMDGLQLFFSLFKEGLPNKISNNKHQYLTYLDQLRLRVLEILVREESLKQIIRSANPHPLTPLFEFRGY